MIKYCAGCGEILDTWGDSVELGLCDACRLEEEEKEEKKKNEQKPSKK